MVVFIHNTLSDRRELNEWDERRPAAHSKCQSSTFKELGIALGSLRVGLSRVEGWSFKLELDKVL